MATPAPGWRTVEEQAASAWKPVEETPPEQPGILKQYWDKVNPANIAQGIAHSVVDLAHGGPEWRESNQQLYNRAIESFKKGDTDWRQNVEGVRHTISWLANSMPGFGTALDEAGNKMASGDYKGAVADTAAMATQILAGKVIPKVTEAATEPGALGRAVDAIAQPARTLIAEVKKPGTPALAVGAAQVASAGPALMTGHPIVAASAAARGGFNIHKGLAQRAAAAEAATKTAAEAAKPAPNPVYEDITKALGGSTYDDLTPEGQATVQKIADDYGKQTSTNKQSLVRRTEFTGPKPTGPIDLGPPAKPGKTIAQEMQDYLAEVRKQQETTSQAWAPVEEPAKEAPAAEAAPVAAQPPGEASQPVSEPAQPIPQAQSDLIPPQPAPEPATTPETPKLEVVPPTLSPESTYFKARARAVRAGNVQTLAQHLHEGGITPEEVAKVLKSAPDAAKFRDLAKAAGIEDLPKDLTRTVEDVQARLTELKASKNNLTLMKPSAEYSKVLKDNPKAKNIAEQLANALSQ